MKDNASGHRLFERQKHWLHGSSGRVRAEKILEYIQDEDMNVRQLIQMANQAFKDSGTAKHSLSRYLWEARHPELETVVDNLSDAEFKEKKKHA